MRACLRFALLVCLVAGVLAVSTRACAPAWPQGRTGRIATESALIVWDEKAKTQHFIRRASFQTKVPYFGFLVPTPTQPRLAEAPDELFRLLEEWTKPEKKTKVIYQEPISLGCPSGEHGGKKARDVQVLDRQHVAGYNAAVLKADDAKALREWLEKHGYDARPQLTEWLEPYIKAGWIITAFQIAKSDQDDDRLSTQAVRMSFQTDRPFFPYREPADLRGEEGKGGRRLLRIFFIAEARMEGKLDDPAQPPMKLPGRAVWANPLDAGQREALAEQLDAKAVPLPEGGWLTVFDDDSSPRPGVADIFFSPSADQSTLVREPIYEYRVVYGPGPCVFSCFVVLAGPVGLWLWLRRGRRRAASGGA
jgi:hypothetical protein